jgi:hypothetical protein
MVNAVYEAVWSDAFWAINNRADIKKAVASDDRGSDGRMNPSSSSSGVIR